MIAENNEILTSAAESLYQYNSDWIVRERCRAREEYERHEQYVKEKFARDEATIKEQEVALREKEAIIEEQRKLLEEQEALIKALKEKNAQAK